MKVSEQFYQHSCGAVVEQGRDCPFHKAITGPILETMALSESAIREASVESSPSSHLPGNPNGPVSLPEHTTPPFHAPTGAERQGSAPTSIIPRSEGMAYLDNSTDGGVEQLPELSPGILYGATTCPTCKTIIDATYPCPFCPSSLPALQDLMPAEANELAIRQMVRDGKANLLRIGLLLVENQDKAYWSVAGKWESWKDFLNSLGLASYSWMTRLVGAARLLNDGKLTAQEIEEIGLGKVAMLLPHRDQLTPELITLAKDGPPQDLREALRELGSKLRKSTEEGKLIPVHCSRCGNDFMWRVK